MNADKSEAICLGTSTQLRSLSAAVDTVAIADTTLPISKEICSLGIIIQQASDFNLSHISTVVKSCKYHLWALQHIRHLLPFSTAQTMACSLVLDIKIRLLLDYCNAVLYVISRLQCTELRRMCYHTDIFAPSQPLLQSLHWLLVQQRLVYKAALIMYRVITMSTPAYLYELLTTHTSSRPTHHSSTQTVPYTLSTFARRSFSFVSPTVWNSLPCDVKSSPSQATFKIRLEDTSVWHYF